jgi:tRNA(fMet)-specific endonuclease VapC
MRYLLDTNICIEIICRKSPELLARLVALPVGEAGVSAITAAELWASVQKSRDPARNAEALAMFLLPLEVAAFDYAAAEAYGRVRAQLEDAGAPIGPLDTLIAGHALSLAAILVTNNAAEFGRVAGLRVEDWLTRP